jgi:Tfp pilus assembly protein PilP
LENLRPAVQVVCAKAHPVDCPGIASGHFQAKTAGVSAVRAFKVSKSGLEQMLLVGTVSEGQYTLSVLDGPRKVAYLSVVSRMPAGDYSGSTGKAIKVRGDAILYEAIEAGSVL